MVKELLNTSGYVEKYGLMAKKALGQNFLLDSNITDKIVRLSMEAQGLNGLEGEEFAEVGPGPGGLTQAVLRKKPRRLTVIEMDERCLAILEEIKFFYPALDIHSGDALKFDWEMKAKEEGAYHIISNLPYNISVVLLTKWLKNAALFKSLTLMFQKEVADRILAHPRTKEYGRISVLAQLTTDVARLFDLAPTCFVPAPKIWSSVLLFLPKKEKIAPEVLAKVEMLTALSFNQRRKMIRQSLKSVSGIAEHLEALGIASTLRAEDLSPEDYLNIAKRLI